MYQILPPGAVPFVLLAVNEEFQRITDTGMPNETIYRKVGPLRADQGDDSLGDYIPAYELVRPVAQAPGDNGAIVEDIRRQPAPVCTCSVCAGLLDPGECGCVCRTCATAGAPARPRPIRRYLLHLCPCCSANVGSMDRWCSTCGQPLYAPPGTGVPF